MTRREPPRLLIEEWLPATAIGIECMRERNSASALSPLTYLHVWWARRPLAASRAAVLGSLLPADFDRATFDRLLGMTERHAIRDGEIQLVSGAAATELAQEQLDLAKAAGRQIPNPHGVRAFRNSLRPADLDRAHDAARALWGSQILVADPMAGGGSIPFEALRIGFDAFASDYNPVAAMVLEATLRFPVEHGPALSTAARRWASELRRRVVDEMRPYFPGAGPVQPYSYLFARTVPCPDTAGNPPTPLIPDWHLVNNGSRRVVAEPVVVEATTGRWTIRVREIGHRAGQLPRPPTPTYADGKGVSLFAGTAIASDYIKAMARAGRLGHAMYAVVHKVPGGLEFRPPTDVDASAWRQAGRDILARRPSWETAGIIPTELYPDITTDERPRTYGMPGWADMYSPRQLLGFGCLVETLQSMRDEVLAAEGETRGSAVLTLLAFAIDKLANYNSLLASWDATKGGSRSVFDRHDFSFKATYSEMSIVYPGAGLEWALDNVLDAYKSLASLPRNEQAHATPTIWQGSATNLPMVASGSVTAVVVDPPYDDNVQYSELADFFYVWLKRTVGWKHPEWFSTYLCEHTEEAVVNLARHQQEHAGPDRRARGEAAEVREAARAFYRDLMAQTFAEARRILRDDGALTVMFTHKKQEAWEALFSALVDGGFRITAAWPVKTESQFSLHQARKNSAESTVLLVARKRLDGGTGYYDATLRAEIAAAARAAAERLEAQGLKPVDQLVGSFGPAMGVFSRYDVVKTDTGEIVPIGVALDLASDAVTAWRVERLAARGIEGIEPEGRFVLMCWDVLGAGEFRFNESKLLGHAVGMNADQLVAAGLVEKKGENITLLSARDRRRDRALTPAEAAGQEVQAGGRGRAKAAVLRVHPNDPLFRTALDGCHALAQRYVEAPTPEAGIGAAKGLATRQAWTSESGVARLMDALVRAAPEAVRRPVGRDSAADRYPEFRAWHAMLGPLFGLETPDWSPRQRAELTLEDVGLFDAAQPDADELEAVGEGLEDGDEG